MALCDADLEPLPFSPHDDPDAQAYAGLSRAHLAEAPSEGKILREESGAGTASDSHAPRRSTQGHVPAAVHCCSAGAREEVRCAVEVAALPSPCAERAASPHPQHPVDVKREHADLFSPGDFHVWRDDSPTDVLNADGDWLERGDEQVDALCEDLFCDAHPAAQFGQYDEAEWPPVHTSDHPQNSHQQRAEWAPESPDSYPSFDTESHQSPAQSRSRSGSSSSPDDSDDSDDMLLQELEELVLGRNSIAAFMPAPVQGLAPTAAAFNLSAAGRFQFQGGSLGGSAARAPAGLMSLATNAENELRAGRDALLIRQLQAHSANMRFEQVDDADAHGATQQFLSLAALAAGASSSVAGASSSAAAAAAAAGRKRQREARPCGVRSGHASGDGDSSSSSSSGGSGSAHQHFATADGAAVSHSTLDEISVMQELMGLISAHLRANPRGERDFEGLKRQLLALPQLRPGVRRTLNGSFKQKVKNLVQERRKRAQLDNWKQLKAAPDLRAELRRRLPDPVKYDVPFLEALARYLEVLFAEDKQAPGNLLDWPEEVRRAVIDKCVFLHAHFYGNRVFLMYEDLGFLFAVGELQLAVLAGCGCADCTAAWRLDAVDRTCLHALKLHWTRQTAALLEGLLAKHVELGAEMVDFVRESEPKLRGWDRKEVNVLLKSLHTSTQCGICKSGKRARHRTLAEGAAGSAGAAVGADEEEEYMADLTLESQREWDFARVYELD